MAEPQTTLITVFHNGIHALKLLWRSFSNANPEPALFWCYDNASNDGSGYYAKSVSNYTFRSCCNYGHGRGLDTLCAKVRTPYTLIADVDVEFLQPATARMIAELKGTPSALCTAYPSLKEECVVVNNYLGSNLSGQKRINPCCAMFDTLKLQQVLKYFSFGVYGGPGKFYDVGAMIYTASLACNLSVLEPTWIRQAVRHYGGIGGYVSGAFPKDSPKFIASQKAYSLIEQRAASYAEPGRKLNEAIFELEA